MIWRKNLRGVKLSILRKIGRKSILHRFYAKSIFGIPEGLKIAILTFDAFLQFVMVKICPKTKFEIFEIVKMTIFELLELSRLVSRWWQKS